MSITKKPHHAILAVTLTGLFLTACDDTRIRVSGDFGPGRHGHHAHHGGHYLTHTPHRHRVSFDTALGMYVVLGLANTYWSNGHYYRYNNHHWLRSSDYRRWSRLNNDRVPSRLYRKYYRPSHGRDRVRITHPRHDRGRVHFYR